MKSQRFEDPELFIVKGQELSLSGQALLELMRAILARGVSFRFCARGWSMAPFIRNGDVITVAPLREGEPGIGNVVAFIKPQTGELAVHRVIARRGAAWLIQGDNVPEETDGLIAPENILGRVRRVERNGRVVRGGLGVEGGLIAWLQNTNTLQPLEYAWFSAKKLWLRLRRAVARLLKRAPIKPQDQARIVDAEENKEVLSR